MYTDETAFISRAANILPSVEYQTTRLLDHRDEQQTLTASGIEAMLHDADIRADIALALAHLGLSGTLANPPAKELEQSFLSLDAAVTTHAAVLHHLQTTYQPWRATPYEKSRFDVVSGNTAWLYNRMARVAQHRAFAIHPGLKSDVSMSVMRTALAHYDDADYCMALPGVYETSRAVNAAEAAEAAFIVGDKKLARSWLFAAAGHTIRATFMPSQKSGPAWRAVKSVLFPHEKLYHPPDLNATL